MDTAQVRSEFEIAWQAVKSHPRIVPFFIQNRLRTMLPAMGYFEPDGRSDYPRIVTFKPTFACNLKCRMCNIVVGGITEEFSDKGLMPPEVWCDLVDQIAFFKPYISITGGEPMVYRGLLDIIRHIKRRGMFVTMTTNATLLARAAERFMEAPTDALIISIDGPKDVHDYIRIGINRSFERTIEGAMKLQEVKRKLGKKVPLVFVNCAISNHNYDRLAEVIEVAKQIGAIGINFQHLWYYTNTMVEEHNALYGDFHPQHPGPLDNTGPEMVDPQVLADVIEKIKCTKWGIPVTFYPNLNRTDILRYYRDVDAPVAQERTLCAWREVDIHPNGDVSPCYPYVAGNIKEEKFVDIWNGEKMRFFRRKLREIGGHFPICVRCCAYFRND